jgi:hypothetical protein
MSLFGTLKYPSCPRFGFTKWPPSCSLPTSMFSHFAAGIPAKDRRRYFYWINRMSSSFKVPRSPTI